MGACATSPPIAADAPVELSGEWNDVDADLVASAIIDDFMKSDWLKEAGVAAPTLRLYPIKNRTTGFIDHRLFTQRFEAAIVRSGRMKVLAASGAPRESDGEDTTREVETEAEADFVLTGTIVAQEDQGADARVVAYLTTVEIVERSSKRKAWIGQKRIRKIIEAQPKSAE